MTEGRPPRLSMRPDVGRDLRSLARRELRGETASEGTITRVTVEVRFEDRTELVSIAVDDGRLAITATDGTTPLSPAALRALTFLAAHEEAPADLDRTSLRPSPKRASKVEERLVELAIAISRSGVETADPASVREALPRLIAELPSPLPLSTARWLARLVTALAESDARQVARLLACTLGELGWPFVGQERAISDRRFIEIGRECIDAHGALPLERRVLVDDDRGELVIEQRYASASTALEASLGPCPRVLEVGLGALADGSPPQLRAQQYTISSEVSHELWDRVEALASSVAVAQAAALSALAAQPAAEPVSLITFPSVEDGALIDGEGTRIPMSKEDVGAVQALAVDAQRERLRWVLVRWATRENGLSAVPLAAAHLDGAAWRHVRFR